MLVKVKQNVPEEKKQVVYQVPCKDCQKVYIRKVHRQPDGWQAMPLSNNFTTDPIKLKKNRIMPNPEMA